jgi:hypothetical protein
MADLFFNETGRQLRRCFEGRKDEKAFAARPYGDGSLCVRRGGNGDRRSVLAVLDRRVSARAIKANEAKRSGLMKEAANCGGQHFIGIWIAMALQE